MVNYYLKWKVLISARVQMDSFTNTARIFFGEIERRGVKYVYLPFIWIFEGWGFTDCYS